MERNHPLADPHLIPGAGSDEFRAGAATSRYRDAMAERTRQVRARPQAGEDSVLEAVAAEEPLTIRIVAGGGGRDVALTMRTPGEDGELALGFLFAEGVIRSAADLADEPFREDGESVLVRLAGGATPDLGPLERHFFTSSACGACGKKSIGNLLETGRPPPAPGPEIDPGRLVALPARMRAAQDGFEATGGLHAAALFDAGGRLLLLREDVGRHNALDKLVGRCLLDGALPLTDRIVVVSGRASFELVQKAAAAGAPILAAVSAPTTLAVATAERTGLTLVAFLRDGRFTVYANDRRVRRGDSPRAGHFGAPGAGE